jgi:hypothetical protein
VTQLNELSCNTINCFHSERLKDFLKEVFNHVVLLLVEKGIVTLKETYLDSTKIEANANRYTFVWGHSISKSIERIMKQLVELWKYAESVTWESLRIKNLIALLKNRKYFFKSIKH